MNQLDNVEASKIFSFLCTEQGQKLIMDDIKEKKLNRIIAAA
jgi:heterodisulfide reductase subunit A-like polyferredoxin